MLEKHEKIWMVTKLSLSFLVQQTKTERVLIKLRKFSMQLTFNSL